MSSDRYDDKEFVESLLDIQKVNRFLGNNRAVIKYIRRKLMQMQTCPGIPLTLLDVATGSGDIPRAIVHWARKSGVLIKITAVDLQPLAVQEASGFTHAYPEITVCIADGLALPFQNRSFDIVLCNKTLHHFGEEDAIKLIQEAARVAASEVLIIDLRRSWTAWLLISILARIFTQNRVTRHDGPLSVLRSYTPVELGKLAERAGQSDFLVKKEPFWLMVLAKES